NLPGNLAIAQHLQPVAQFFYYAEFHQTVGAEAVAGQSLEVAQVDDGELLLENIGKAALRQTAVQRHLAAFKSAHDAVSGNRAGTLAAAGGSLAPARTHTAANALLAVFLPGGWF